MILVEQPAPQLLRATLAAVNERLYARKCARLFFRGTRAGSRGVVALVAYPPPGDSGERTLAQASASGLGAASAIGDPSA